jgi:hypothetical protein
MQSRRRMALHHKAMARFLFNLRRRFGRFREAPFSFVLVE